MTALSNANYLHKTQVVSRLASQYVSNVMENYRGADESLVRTTSRCVLFDDENISFDASLVICINSTNLPLIMIINRIYEHLNLLLL